MKTSPCKRDEEDDTLLARYNFCIVLSVDDRGPAMKRPILAKRVASVLAAVILAFGLMPTSALAASPSDAEQGSSLAAPQRSDAEIEASIDAMLATGDYVEGEAIVCSLGSGVDGVGAMGAQSEASDDLLAGAEGMSTVTAEQYAEGTGESLPAADPQGGLTTQSADVPVEILLVHKDGTSTEGLLRALLHDTRVLSAEPNYVMEFESDDEGAQPAKIGTDSESAKPQPDYSLSTGMAVQDDDPVAASDDFTDYQWFCIGGAAAVPQYIGGANPGVKPPNWNDPTKTNASGVVAIMDSGVDYTHPDLKNVMYHFTPELQAELGCGEFGYAPGREDKTDPMDGLNHGTHCAGIVAAEWNDFGVSGVANGVKICAVSISKSITNSGFSYDAIIKGYDFLIRAAKAGVDIRSVNRSLGCAPVNNANQAMIQAAGEAGIVTCIASGNNSADLDTTYDDASVIQPSPYILRVDAAKVQDARAGFSNIGRYTTDLFAPGAEILSTVPSNLKKESRYFPQADDAPLYCETSFDGDLLDVTCDSSNPSDTSSPHAEIKSVEKGAVGVDGDSKSLKVEATVPVNIASFIYVDVPVGSLSKDDVQDISIAMHAGDVAIRGMPYSSLSVQLEDGTYPRDGISNATFGSPGGWSFASLNIPDPAQLTQGFKQVTDTHGRTCIRLRIGAQFEVEGKGDGESADIELYLDQIAIGKRGNSGNLPYQYMNGTSMATPIVTASAAIASSGITGVSPDVRAAQTVRKLKGAVHQTEGYRGFCKQNGQLDLSLLDASNGLVPVLESAEVQGTRVTLKGAYFGEQGTLTVGDVGVQVVSWSDASITAEWPQDVVSGLIPIVVKTSDGAEACRAFILVAPDAVQGSAVLYERDLVPFSLRADGLSIMDAPQSLAATDDSVLFAAVADADDHDEATVRFILRSDDKGLSWKQIALPVELKLVSLAVGGNTLYIWGATPASNPVAIDGWHLYAMDISTNEVRHLRDYTVPSEEVETEDADVTETGSLAYANGNLFFVYAYGDVLSEEDPFTRMYLQKFNDDYSLGEPVSLKRKYPRSSFYDGPKVAATGNSIYICGLVKKMPRQLKGNLRGLERVDVDADGSLSYADLSATVDGISDDISPEDICMAAGDQGVILIGSGLEGLLPEGAQAVDTDTYLLKPGATAFEAYPKTLSYEPVLRVRSVVANGELYAYGISKYENTSMFGRSTQLPAPEPVKITKSMVKVANATYTGKALEPKVTVKAEGKTLEAGIDYDLTYENNTNAGTGVAIVAGKGSYAGVASKTFTIYKKANGMTAKAKKSQFAVSAKTLKSKNVSIAKTKAFKIYKATGKVTFKMSGVSKKAKGKITVTSAGKVTLKKGLGKGTYAAKVKVTAAGNANVKAKTVPVTLKFKVS